MKKKSLITVLFAFIVCFALVFVACNNTADNGDNADGDNKQEVENPEPAPAPSENRILVVYFSYSGNTKRVANEIIAQSKGDGVELVPAIPYTAADVNYNNSDSRSQTERRDDARPEISGQTYGQIDMENYDTVIIGYPIWNGYEPMIIRTFIEHYNGLPGKTVYTFSTAASSGGSAAHNSIKSRVTATVGSNLHFTSSALSGVSSSVRNWLSGWVN